PQEPVELVALEQVELGRDGRAYGGRAGAAVEEADLPEEPAGAEAGQRHVLTLLVGNGHLDPARADQVEAVAPIAQPEDVLVCLEVDLLHVAHEGRAVGFLEAAEERDVVERSGGAARPVERSLRAHGRTGPPGDPGDRGRVPRA